MSQRICYAFGLWSHRCSTTWGLSFIFFGSTLPIAVPCSIYQSDGHHDDIRVLHFSSAIASPAILPEQREVNRELPCNQTAGQGWNALWYNCNTVQCGTLIQWVRYSVIHWHTDTLGHLLKFLSCWCCTHSSGTKAQYSTANGLPIDFLQWRFRRRV